MALTVGAQQLLNGVFDNLTNITNVSGQLTTFEIDNGALHIAGPAGSIAQLTISGGGVNMPQDTLFLLSGGFEIVSGSLGIRSSAASGVNIFASGPQRWYLQNPGVIDRVKWPGTWALYLRFITTGEAFFDYLVLQPILSGAMYMPSVATYAYVDYDGDNRQFTLPITDADAATHDARYTQVQALSTAIDGISKLARTKTDFVIERDETGAAKPSDQAAQVNIEWLVKYVDDTTGAVESVRIGGADLTLAGVLQPGSNVANLAQTEMAAFVTAFEAVVRSSAGNAVSVQSVEFRE